MSTSQTRPRLSLTGSSVLPLAGLLIALHLLVRAWAVYGSWFNFDDANFLSVVYADRLDLHTMLTGYAGHLMPGAFSLSWVNLQLGGPLAWAWPATELLVIQAIADVGALVFLVSAFGRRPAILVPFILFISTALAVPAMISWGPGITQGPFLCALFWGGWTHLTYLRTAQFRWAAATAAITVTALLFGEKTLLIFWLYAFLALAYFARGDLIERLGQVLRRYRAGVVLYTVVVAGYVAWYASVAINYHPGDAASQPLLPLIQNLVGVSWLTGVLGGPFRWDFQPGLAAGLASPGQLFILLCLAAMLFLAVDITRHRRRSARAWLLVGIFLASDILVLGSARVALTGADIALLYRYVTEMAAVSAIALGLATLPLLDAPEQVEPAPERRWSLAQPSRAGAFIVVVAVLGTFSATHYVRAWQDEDATEIWLNNASLGLTTAPPGANVVDSPVPSWMIWGVAYPDNMTSSLLHPWADHIEFDHASNDHLSMVDEHGHLRPALISTKRQNAAGATSGCPFPATDGTITIPLDQPALGFGWWIRVSYAAKSAVDLSIDAGATKHELTTETGLHNMFFTASGDNIDSVTLTGDPQAMSDVCVTDLHLGTATPAPDEVQP